MDFIIRKEDLQKALAELALAEGHWFNYCDAIFKLKTYGSWLDECFSVYDGLCEKAYPDNASFNWGRGQHVTRDNIFKDGKLIPITEVK